MHSYKLVAIKHRLGDGSEDTYVSNVLTVGPVLISSAIP